MIYIRFCHDLGVSILCGLIINVILIIICCNGCLMINEHLRYNIYCFLYLTASAGSNTRPHQSTEVS